MPTARVHTTSDTAIAVRQAGPGRRSKRVRRPLSSSREGDPLQTTETKEKPRRQHLGPRLRPALGSDVRGPHPLVCTRELLNGLRTPKRHRPRLGCIHCTPSRGRHLGFRSKFTHRSGLAYQPLTTQESGADSVARLALGSAQATGRRRGVRVLPEVN